MRTNVSSSELWWHSYGKPTEIHQNSGVLAVCADYDGSLRVFKRNCPQNLDKFLEVRIHYTYALYLVKNNPLEWDGAPTCAQHLCGRMVTAQSQRSVIGLPFPEGADFQFLNMKRQVASMLICLPLASGRFFCFPDFCTPIFEKWVCSWVYRNTKRI